MDVPRGPTAYRRAASYARLAVTCAMIAAVLCAPQGALGEPREQPLARGIVWQIDYAHLEPKGDWQKLGVTDVLLQWTAVDDMAFVPGTTLPVAPSLPDWARIAREPWAQNVVVGLAARFDERNARDHVAELIEQSLRLAAAPPPVHVDGWYFPVEVDPTWTGAASLGLLLDRLPRPLWISVYDNSNMGGEAFAAWLDGWLPHDVGVFLQDGCGAYIRSPGAARQYADALAARLGKGRVRIIAEASRVTQGGAVRAATAEELAPQLAAYRGYRTYLFDGPHFVSPELVQALLRLASSAR
ncbi:alpha-amylase family protein [Paraburkholderia sediminicola]|uniref:hypothetical protein n=1 Tax=Paraburkholderia sediminicola TaxID=458836 RepID=UPI0038B6D3DE